MGHARHGMRQARDALGMGCARHGVRQAWDMPGMAHARHGICQAWRMPGKACARHRMRQAVDTSGMGSARHGHGADPNLTLPGEAAEFRALNSAALPCNPIFLHSYIPVVVCIFI